MRPAVGCGLEDASGLSLIQDGKITNFTLHNGSAAEGITALARARDGGLWVGTDQGTLHHLKEGAWTTFGPKFGAPAIPVDTIECIYEDKEGTLWLGSSAGLIRFRGGQSVVFTPKEWAHQQQRPSGSGGRPRAAVDGLQPGRPGRQKSRFEPCCGRLQRPVSLQGLRCVRWDEKRGVQAAVARLRLAGRGRQALLPHDGGSGNARPGKDSGTIK